MSDWKKSRVEEARRDMSVSAARAQVAALCKDACITPREVAALEMLLEASDPARLPRLLAPGEEIPPGCTAEMRAAVVSGPPGASCAHKVEDRIYGVAARGLPAPWTCGACLTDQPKGPPSADPAGPYTRAQFAAAVDEAHAAIHVATNDTGGNPWPHITRAHQALHRVGAGLERVDCATADPEAQRLLADLLDAGQREIPCGHKIEDLIYGVAEIGRPPVTKCGACLAALPKREPAQSRAFSPHGRTSEQIATAAGVAARELCAEHEPGAGAVVEVRLVRRGGGAA